MKNSIFLLLSLILASPALASSSYLYRIPLKGLEVSETSANAPSDSQGSIKVVSPVTNQIVEGHRFENTNFGGYSDKVTFAVKNESEQTAEPLLTISGAPYLLDEGTCNTPISPAGQCEFSIRMLAASAEGEQPEGLLTLQHKGNVLQTIPLGGTAIDYAAAITWTPASSPFPSSESIAGIAYGKGHFVAVGGSATITRVATSTDGVTWTLRHYSSQTGAPNSVVFGDSGFVAPLRNGKVLTSPDGISWNSVTVIPSSTKTGNSAAFAKGKYLVVFSSDGIYESTDLSTWRKVSTPLFGAYATRVTSGLGKFFGLGADTAGYNLAVSSNGSSWSKFNAGIPGYSTLYAGVEIEDKMVVSGSINTPGGAAYFSTDGLSWSPAAGDRGFIIAMAYHRGLALGVGSGGQVKSSPTGEVWVKRNTIRGKTRWGLAYGAGKFVAVGDEGSIDYYAYP